MAITDKTRKILWGKSGNKCAICKQELVREDNFQSNYSIIGEECHIISGKKNGPRYDPSFPVEKLDSYENLILLCASDHKMIDDFSEIYTVEKLRQIKEQHEKWVSKNIYGEDMVIKIKLINQKILSSVGRAPDFLSAKIKLIKQKIPDYLLQINSGKELLNIIEGAHAFSYDYDNIEKEEELRIISSFLDDVYDWGDLAYELGPGANLKIEYDFTKYIETLSKYGLSVFGGRIVEIFEKEDGKIFDWITAIIKVLHANNSSIIKIKQSK